MTVERFSIIDHPRPSLGQTIKILYDVDAGPDYHVKRWKYNSVDFIAVLTKSGSGSLSTRDADFVLKKNDLIVIGADQLNDYRVNGNSWSFLWFEFESDCLPLEPFVVYNLQQKNWHEAEVEACLFYMKQNKGEIGSAIFTALLYRWADAIDAIEREEEYSLVNRSVSYIRENIKTVTVKMIAEKLYLSDRTLRNMYERYLGLSPSQVIRRIRFKEAKNLLESSGDSIAQISEKLGYESPICFGKAFTKYVGISPTKYRNRANTFRAGVNNPEVVDQEKISEL